MDARIEPSDLHAVATDDPTPVERPFPMVPIPSHVKLCRNHIRGNACDHERNQISRVIASGFWPGGLQEVIGVVTRR